MVCVCGHNHTTCQVYCQITPARILVIISLKEQLLFNDCKYCKLGAWIQEGGEWSKEVSPPPKQLTEPKLATFNTHMPTEKKYCKLHTAQLHSGNTIQAHNRIILSTVCSSCYKQPSLPLELVMNSQRDGYLVAARWFKGEANGKMTAV